MLPLVDKPTIQYIVEDAVRSGVKQIVIVTGQSKRAIEDHFDYPFELATRLREQNKLEELSEVERISELANFVYVRQKQPLGNGHAVLVTKEVVGREPFAVLWGDDLVDAEVPLVRQMMDVYERFGGSVLAVMRVPQENVPKYGIVGAKPGWRRRPRTWRR
jgi:UTP--glucose-1-phosphate uridylyltransferase